MMLEATDEPLYQLACKLRDLAENVRCELVCGFDEPILQNAFAVELREHNIEYLKEVNIEIFYKSQYVGVDRPDFVIVDLKLAKDTVINADNRTQLKSYCTSFPLNKNPVLTNFSGGILLIFPKGDVENTGRVKLFVVNRESNIIKDEQKDEKETTRLAKAAKRLEPKNKQSKNDGNTIDEDMGRGRRRRTRRAPQPK